MQTFELKIDGMTCGGCANRLMSSVKVRFPEIRFSADHATASGLIVIDDGNLATEYIEYINKLGYKSCLAEAKSDNFQKSSLLKIAIAFFCFANIMFFALAEYLSNPGELPVEYIAFFRSISAILCSVSLFYCASDMHIKAFHSLIKLKPNVDLSISFALIATYLYSLTTLFHLESAEPFFDSVAATLFFILSGRYLQQRFLFRTQNNVKNKETHQFEMVRRKTASGNEIVGILQIMMGDILLIRNGDVFPVDCTLLDKEAVISTDLITGEILPQNIVKGATIQAGSVSVGQEISCQSIADGSSSKLRDMKLKSLQMSFAKSELVNASDKMASIFFALVLVTASFCFVMFYSVDLQMAIARAVAILLIACPCAFAVAIPLASLRCASEAASKNILFRNVSAMQKLAQCRTIFFDKTGTLSKNSLKITREVWMTDQQEELKSVLQQVTNKSNHPVSQALNKYLSNVSESVYLTLEVKEFAGKGITFNFKKEIFHLGNRHFCKVNPGELTEADLFLTDSNGHLLAVFDLSEQKIDDLDQDLQALDSLGMYVQVISGDSHKRVQSFSNSVGIKKFVAEASPDNKQLLVEGSPCTAMVGNGFNDLLAISKSSVGISTANSDSATYMASDIHLLEDTIAGIPLSIQLTRGMIKNLRSAFVFSSIYNFVGMTAAFMGFVNPVVAAILMPINSVIVGSIAARKVK